MKLHTRILIYIFLTIFFHASLGVYASDIFHRITEDEGLSSRMCFSVEQDKHGFIWISTKMGIDRFDGKNIRHYQLDISQSPGYSNIGVNYLSHSRDKTLWAFNEAGIIYRYDEDRDTFQPIYEVRNYFDNYSIILNNILFHSPESILLSTSKGVLEYHFDNQEVHLWKGTENMSVNQISKYEGRYYLSTSKGLYIVEPTKNHEIEIHDCLLPDINILLIHPEAWYNQIIIGTLNAGIYIWKSGSSEPPFKTNLPITNPVRAISSYGKEQLAIGVDLEGVFIVDAQNLSIQKAHVANEATSSSIVSNNVRGLFVDNQGNLWIATYHGGVSFQDSSKLNFQTFVHQLGSDQSIADNVVNAVLEDSDGNFWFGTNNGVSTLNRKTNRWKHYFNKSTTNEKGAVILALCEDSQGNIWAGGYSFGVACINPQTGNTKQYKAGEQSSMISTNYIYAIYADGNTLWFGGLMGNVTSWNVLTGKSKTYNVSKVNAFERLDNKHILLGLFNGLFILDTESGETTTTGISQTVNTIYRIEDGRYLVGTRNYGFYYYDIPNNEKKRYTTEQKLSSNYIYGVVPDEDHNLWIATENGLNKLLIQAGEVELFDKQDGLPSNEFTSSSSYLCCDRSILMGTMDGAILFNPLEIKRSENITPYVTYIYQFDLYNEPVHSTDKGSVLEASIYETQEIKLAYNKNFFSFHFATPNFQTPRKTLYSYYLEGHDLDWSLPLPVNMATYSRVPPGDYIFHVHSVIDGIAQQSQSLAVHISQPWWNTLWARLFYLILVLASIFYMYRVIKRRQEKKNTEAKMDFFVTTAHDLLTPLNLIQAPLKDLEQEIQPSSKAGQLLSMAINNSLKLAHYVEKLLDFQRISLNASRLVVSSQVLQTFLRHRIDSFKLVAGNKFITIESNLDETTVNEIWFDKEKISRILDNLLSNAIKYTPYGGKITIEASVDQHKWYLRVKDNGIGISPRDQRMIFKHIFRAENAINTEEIGSGIGLKLVGSLVNLHKGKISFRSKVGEGTEFLLSFPLVYEKTVNYRLDSENALIEEEQKAISTATNRILIVEDDPEMSRYIEMSLSDKYQVKVRSNGKEALDIVDSFSPHLILSDVLMPEMTGFELCEKLKSNIKTSHIPVVLLTGLTDTKSVVEGIRLGAIDYINKPFDKEILRNKIANIFELQRTAQRQCIEELKNNNAIELSNKADNEFMEKLQKLIDANIDNPELNIPLMCSELAMSRTLLYNKITQLTGKSPTEFIRIFRLKRAATLLLSGEHSVTDVAFRVGIDNPKYFSRIFKEFYGVSPKEYLAKGE